MDTPRGDEDVQRPGDFTVFGARLLQRAREKVTEAPPPGQHLHQPYSFALVVNPSMDEVRRVLGGLPDDKHVEALLLMMSGMIINDLFLYTATLPE